MSDPSLSKPLLGISGAILFGSVCLYSSDSMRKVISLLIAANALLCHMEGCVGWDVFFNTALVSYFLLSRRIPKELLSVVASGVVAWAVNHSCIDSAFLHAVLVQGVGAYVVWNLDFKA